MTSQIDVDKIRNTSEVEVLTFEAGGNMVLAKDLKFSSLAAIKDSAGNNIISESAGVVTLSSDAAVISGSSTGDLVRITQTGTGNALVVEDEANPDSTPFVVDATGTVLIGSTTAENTGYHLEVKSGGNSVIKMQADDASTNYFGMGTATDALKNNINVYNNSGSPEMNFNVNSAVRIRIDSSGRVTMPYQPAFDVNTASSNTGDLKWITVSSNIGNHYNTSTGYFTAPVAGHYLFTVTVGNNSSYTVDIKKNGSIYRRTEVGSPAGFYWSTASLVMYLAPNDIVNIGVSSGTPSTNAPYGGFSGCLLG